MEESKKIVIEAGKLRKAFTKTYSSIQKEFNETNEELDKLSKRLYDLSIKIDEFLQFIQKLEEQFK